MCKGRVVANYNINETQIVAILWNTASWQLDRIIYECGIMWGGASWPTSLIPFLSYCHSKWRMRKDPQHICPKQPMSWMASFRMSPITEATTNDFPIIHAMWFVEATWNMPFTCLCTIRTVLDSNSGSQGCQSKTNPQFQRKVSTYNLFIMFYPCLPIRPWQKLCHQEPSSRTSNI